MLHHAAGRMDQLTVVSHEIGCLLGMDHDALDRQPLMGEALSLKYTRSLG